MRNIPQICALFHSLPSPRPVIKSCGLKVSHHVNIQDNCGENSEQLWKGVAYCRKVG